MKSGIFQGSKWVSGLAVATLLLSLGCSLHKTDAENESAGAEAPAPSTETNAAPATVTEAPPPPTSQPPSAPVIPADLSPGVAEIVKLAQAQVGEEVMLAYVTNQAANVHPTADELIYLTDLGVSDKVIAVLAQRAAPAEAPAEPQPAEPAPLLETQPPAAPVQGSNPAFVASEPAVAPPAPVAEAPVQVEPPQPVSNEYFYDNLAPYGSWVEVPDYGLCWQPTVVVANPGWQPYCDRGHWVYTDCGWYWQSDYTWGWAPFHYGRWFHHGRHGWVWRPDGVWGPSWVSWRHTDAYCGWAPLPPAARFEVGVGLTFHGSHVAAEFDFGLQESAFTFVSINHFYDRRPDHFRVPPAQVHGFYRNSTIVNNISADHAVAHNGGISRDRIALANRRDIRPVNIRSIAVNHPPGSPVRMERMETGGRTLDVYHPNAVANRPVGPATAKAPVLINKGTPLPPPASRPSAFSTARPTPAESPAPVASSAPSQLPSAFNRGSDTQTRLAPSTKTELPVNRQTPTPATTTRPTPPSGLNRGGMPGSASRFNNSGNSLPRSTGNIPATTHPAEVTPPVAAPTTHKTITPPVTMPTTPRTVTPPVTMPTTPRTVTPPVAMPTTPRTVTPPVAMPTTPRTITPPVTMPTAPRTFTPPPAAAPEPRTFTPPAPRAYTPPVVAPAPEPAPRAFNPPASAFRTPEAQPAPAPRVSTPSAPPAASQPAQAPRSAPSAPPSASSRSSDKDKNK